MGSFGALISISASLGSSTGILEGRSGVFCSCCPEEVCPSLALISCVETSYTAATRSCWPSPSSSSRNVSMRKPSSSSGHCASALFRTGCALCRRFATLAVMALLSRNMLVAKCSGCGLHPGSAWALQRGRRGGVFITSRLFYWYHTMANNQVKTALCLHVYCCMETHVGNANMMRRLIINTLQIWEQSLWHGSN